MRIEPESYCSWSPKTCSPMNENADSLRTLQKQAAQGGRKRIFLGLLSISSVLVCLLLLLFFVAPWLGSGTPWLAPISITIGLLGIFIFTWFSLTLVYHIYTGRNFPGMAKARHLCVRIFLPLMEIAGKVVGIEKNTVRRSFIKINNEFVCANAIPLAPHELLVLLPHCIQNSHCGRRLGADLSNCTGCGKCQLADLRNLGRKYGCRIAVASGGTIARRIVAAMKPKQIIAVACERDLTSGIQDSYPIPVFGALNERPFGPCKDTQLPLHVIEKTVRWFLKAS